jgi:hypothetical protein
MAFSKGFSFDVPNSWSEPFFKDFNRALDAIERLISYNEHSPVFLMIDNPDSQNDSPNQLNDPIERALIIIDNISNRLTTERELRELSDILINKLPVSALIHMNEYIIQSDEQLVPFDFLITAASLSLIASITDTMPKLKNRCRALAKQCATQVSRDHPDFPLLVHRFKNDGIEMPNYSPYLQGEYTISIDISDGKLIILSQKSIEEYRAIQSKTVNSESVSEADILNAIDKSLMGLVGLEKFKTLLAMDIHEFLKVRQSRGRVFWGVSGVGKTEVAQRLSGLREGFPPISIGLGQVKYISGVDGKLEISELVDELSPFSLLFIDEADKCFDSKAGMVNFAEATQIRHSILTHFQRKPILWVFLGVFAQMQSNGRLTDETLRVSFGDELAHRLDYADWEFPYWTLENLLKAISVASSRRKLQYDDDAALLLAQYCISTGGGVRAFDNLESAISRYIRTSGYDTSMKVSLPIAMEILKRRGVHTN